MCYCRIGFEVRYWKEIKWNGFFYNIGGRNFNIFLEIGVIVS